MSDSFRKEPGQTLADIELGHGVVLLLARDDRNPDLPWEVWGVEIDGERYREPSLQRLKGDPLKSGPFADWLNAQTVNPAPPKITLTKGPGRSVEWDEAER